MGDYYFTRGTRKGIWIWYVLKIRAFHSSVMDSRIFSCISICLFISLFFDRRICLGVVYTRIFVKIKMLEKYFIKLQ